MNQTSGKTKTIIWVTLLLAVVVIGIGYAAISATNLNISGTASATGDTTDFVVKFDDSVEIATAGQGTTSGDIVNNTTGNNTINNTTDNSIINNTNPGNNTTGGGNSLINTIKNIITGGDNTTSQIKIPHYIFVQAFSIYPPAVPF